METAFRQLPSVEKLLSDERIAGLGGTFPRDVIVAVIRHQLEKERQLIRAGKPCSRPEKIVTAVLQAVADLGSPALKRVINASGVILHTNLGRAPLSQETLAAMAAAGCGYNDLEFDLATGRRGSRHVHIEPLLCQVTGAEAGVVVNNNAAAVLLGLTALARRKEVIVSRGQAVEIGGGFRIPDVLRQSGARLVEVGTTNITYASDYAEAIGPRTAALLRVHSSNFRVVGFTNEVTLEEMVAVAREKNIIVLDDLGSGCFLDTSAYGLAPEPMVQQSVRTGAALTFFSGDKLVGGPQAGIVVGAAAYVEKLKRHPLARALRIDKIRLAGLAATLVHYIKGEAVTRIPVWRMIAAPLEEIEGRAREWARAVGGDVEVVRGETMVGGGSLPGGTLPTCLVALPGGKNGVMKLAEKLRRREMPVIARISDERLLLDPRTVLPEEDPFVVRALEELKKA